MKLSGVGLAILAASATAFAQGTTSNTPPQALGSSATGTIMMSGCVGGGVGAGPITIMNPTIVPSTMQPASVAAAAAPTTIQPATVPPSALTPPTSLATGTVGTTGITSVTTTASPSVVSPGGTTSLSASGGGPIGYRLTGTDMSSWIGRHVQIVGTLAPMTSETDATSASAGNPASFQEFQVQTVVQLTGVCPQP